jgi:hypothetical protein
MVDFGYLAKGLAALSRAHQVSPMVGHLGAAVVTGYFISEQHPDLDSRVVRGIEGVLGRIIRGESVFGPRKTSSVSVGDLFAPIGKERPQENLIDGVAEALAANIDQTRESGHNVIFASIAIRALKGHPEFSTPSVVDGIRKLLAGFNHAKPGSGYFGKQRGRLDDRHIPLPMDPAFPPYRTPDSMAEAVMSELIRHAPERRDGFGGLWHVINHAALLVELSQCGYRELALRGLPAHHQHLQLLRSVPDVAEEPGVETPVEHDPRTPAFWQSGNIRRDRARLDHRIKTLYGSDTLVELVKDSSRRSQANEKLRYLM